MSDRSCRRQGCFSLQHSSAGLSSIEDRTTTVSAGTSESNKSDECQPFRTLLRSEEHTSELQSLMRISYAVFCLKKKEIEKIDEGTHGALISLTTDRKRPS